VRRRSARLSYMNNQGRVVAMLGAGLLALASALLPSPKGLEIIKQHEGFVPTAYYDAVKVPTICWGSTSKVYMGYTATLAECEERLIEDATYAGRGVSMGVKVKLTQDQYDALVSFVYNVGETKFYSSTLLRKLNSGDCRGAAEQFDLWVYAKKKKLRGLVIRRATERKLFEQSCSAWSQAAH